MNAPVEIRALAAVAPLIMMKLAKIKGCPFRKEGICTLNSSVRFEGPCSDENHEACYHPEAEGGC